MCVCVCVCVCVHCVCCFLVHTLFAHSSACELYRIKVFFFVCFCFFDKDSENKSHYFDDSLKKANR